MKADLIVIGGGPAGLSAATAAAALGAEVVVVDEAPVPGGRLRLQLHEHPGPDGKPVWWRGGEEAEKLLGEARASNVRILPATSVWGLFPGWTIPVTGREAPEELEARAVILATGATQRSLVMEGWTLPGVVAVGTAQSMVNQYRIKPGRRALIVGIDILSLTLARQFVMTGIEVAGVVLPPPGVLSGKRARPSHTMEELMRLAPMAPSLPIRLAGQLFRGPAAARFAARFYPKSGVSVWGVPVMARRAALAIQGDEEVETVLLADVGADGNVIPGTERTEQVDVVVLSGGLSPLAELAQQAGCQMIYVEELGGYLPLHGPDLATTVPGLFVAGNITGVEGAPVAMAQGRLAGLNAAAYLGKVKPDEREAALATARAHVAEVRRHSAIQFHPGIVSARSRLSGHWEASLAGPDVR